MPRYIDLNKLASEMMSKDDFFFFLLKMNSGNEF